MMRRKEFLEQLERLLWDISEQERKEALEFYENYLMMPERKMKQLLFRSWEVREKLRQPLKPT